MPKEGEFIQVPEDKVDSYLDMIFEMSRGSKFSVEFPNFVSLREQRLRSRLAQLDNRLIDPELHKILEQKIRDERNRRNCLDGFFAFK